MLNEVSVAGRLTAEPEMRYTKSQKPVLTFSLAVDHDRVDQDGNRGCEFFNMVAWNGIAEWINKYFSKGSFIICHGKLRNNHWTDKDGKKRVTTEIVVSEAYFGGGSGKKTEEDFTEPEFEELDDGPLPF